MEHTRALNLAMNYVEFMRPYCERIEIAGSLRRLKPEVHDIDLVCIPKAETVQADLFGNRTEEIIPLHSILHDLQKSGDLVKIKGKTRYFQFSISGVGLNLELYCVLPPAQWGVIYTIRTGPAEFGHWLVTPRNQGGALPSHSRVINGAVWRNHQTPIPMSEEQDFLNYLGLGWIQPKDRQPRWPQQKNFSIPANSESIDCYTP